MIKKLLLLLALCSTAYAQQHGFVREFDTLDQLVAPTNNPSQLHKVSVLKGLGAINDGNGGLIYWNPGDTTATNATDVFASLFPGAVGRFRWIQLGHTIPPAFVGGVTNYTAITVPTIADLKNVQVTNGIQFVYVQGYSTPGDRGQGLFVWDDMGVLPDDGGRIITPNSNPLGNGTWIRQLPSPQVLATEFWGAVLTGTNVNNGPINAALAYAASIGGASVVLPPIDCRIDATQPIRVPSNVILMGQKGSRIIISDNPATNYACFVFSGVSGSSLQNVALTGWDASPPGNASNTGYGVVVTNSTNVVLGGILYGNDFYTQPLLLTNSADVRIYDEGWTRNSIRGYGAQGNNINDDSAAVAQAIVNTSPKGGSEILFPPGIYAMNVQATNCFGVSLLGMNDPGSGTTNTFLVPFNPTNAVLQFGAPGSSIICARSVRIGKLCFDYRGPSFVFGQTNTYGQKGLSLQGGCYEFLFDGLTVQGFARNGLEFVGGITQPVSVVGGTVNVYMSDDTAIASTRGLYARYRLGGGGYVTDIRLEGKFAGSSVAGYLIEDDGVTMDIAGYADIYSGHGILNKRTDLGPFHHILGKKLVLDTHSGLQAVENVAGAALYPWGCIGGEIDTTANVLHSDAQSYPIYNNIPVGGNTTNFSYFGFMYGPMTWNLPGTYRPLKENFLYNDSQSNLIAQTTNSFSFTHVDGGHFRVKAYTNNANFELQDSTGTAVMQQNAGLFRFLPAAPNGELRLDNGLANRVISISSNSVSEAIRVTSTGVGMVNQVAPAWPLAIGVNSTVVNDTMVGIGSIDTNLSGSSATLVIQQQANPATNNTTTWETVSIEGGTHPSATNANLIEPLRVAFTHRNANKVTNIVMAHITAPAITVVGGLISNSTMLKIDDVGTTQISQQTGDGRLVHGANTLEYTHNHTYSASPSTQIANDAIIVRISGNGGPVTCTNVPSLLAGNDGQEMTIVGTSDSQTWELVDKGTLPGSNVKLGNGLTNKVFTAGEGMRFRYDTTLGYWHGVH